MHQAGAGNERSKAFTGKIHRTTREQHEKSLLFCEELKLLSEGSWCGIAGCLWVFRERLRNGQSDT